jgi:acyl-CoA reductase-like NAD-dependent aldehyde dehydrogenase
MTGEVQPLDISPRAKGYQGIWKRVPIGPCSFISPFNFPAQPRRAQDRAGARGRLPVRR